MVKNEEAAIKPTLKPFLEAGINHYLILDTGSTDQTVKITRDLFKKYQIAQGHIAEKSFVDFATSRNYALQCAEEKFPNAAFFLMIDAEWQISNVHALIQFCEEHIQDKHDAYGINIVANDTLSHYLYCLFRASSKLRYKGAIHEVIDTQCAKKAPLSIFFRYNPSKYGAQKSEQRLQKDVDLLVKQLESYPNNACILLYLAQTYDRLNDYSKAINYYTQRCTINGGDENDFFAYFSLAQLYERLNDGDKAVANYLEAYNKYPHRAEPLIYLAHYYLDQKKYNLSFYFATEAVKIPFPSDDNLTISRQLYDYTRHEILANAAHYLNEGNL